jgi:hypothetical protein
MRLVPLFLIASAVLALGCPWGGRPMPEELIGEWKTSAEKFKGFSFELTKDAVIFKDLNSTKGPEINHIEKIRMDRQDGKLLYTIHNRTEQGLEHKFAFYYDPKRREIRLKNQDRYVWKKKK